MAVTTLVTRKRLVAAKLETTQGIAEALAAADATIPVYDPKWTFDIPANRRKAPGSASDFPQVPGARGASLTFTTHLANSGTATIPAWASNFLAAGGFVNAAGTFSPVTGSATQATLTAGFYQAGRLKTIVGSSAAFVIKGVAGSPVTVDWTLTGKWAVPTATAILAPTYITVIPPRFAGATVTVGGTAYKVSEFELDYGNKIAMVRDATDVTGYYLGIVADREPTLTLKVMSLGLATKDWYADHVAGTEAAFVCAVGSGANGVVTINAPKLQLTDPPEDEDTDGYMSDVLKFQLNRNAADDTESTIVFS